MGTYGLRSDQYVARVVDGKVIGVVPVHRFRLRDGSLPSIEHLIPLGYAEIDYDCYKPADETGFYPLPYDQWEVVEGEVKVRVWNQAKKKFSSHTVKKPYKVRVRYGVREVSLAEHKNRMLASLYGAMFGDEFELARVCLILLCFGDNILAMKRLSGLRKKLTSFLKLYKAIHSATSVKELQQIASSSLYKNFVENPVQLSTVSFLEELIR